MRTNPHHKGTTLSKKPQISHTTLSHSTLNTTLFYKMESLLLIRSLIQPQKSSHFKMQTALTFAAPNVVVPLAPTKSVSNVTIFPTNLKAPRSSPCCSPIRVAAAEPDTSTVDYNSAFSVFPAEACETVGGEACMAEMYPETKLQPEAKTAPVVTENVEREYLEYDDPKTVFRGEACDDLGGTFCETEYQKGVY